MAKTDIDEGLVNSLAGLLQKNNLSEIEYEAEGVRIKVAANTMANVAVPVNMGMNMSMPANVAAQGKAAKCAAEPADKGEVVKSPMVGVVYTAPEPDAAPYVKVGDTVKQGQTLFLIEAMKTFNAVRAPRNGKVVEVLVKDSQPVEYAEPLLVLE